MATQLGQYRGIEVTVTPTTFGENELQQQLDYLIQSNPIVKSKEGPVENGDITIIDFEGFKDGVAFDGGKAENYELAIGSGSFIPGFEEQMVGMAKGETKDLALTFPANYPSEELAGADVIFTVTVHDIQTKESATLNDEFVQSLNIPDVSTVDDITEYVKSYLQYQADKKTRETTEDLIMNALLDQSEATLAEDAIELAMQQQVSRISMELQQNGITLDQYFQMTGTSMDSLKKDLREFAKKQVKLEMILTQIAIEEAIEITEEEIEEQYQLIADNYNEDINEVKKIISIMDMRSDLAKMKASQIVLQSAIVHQN